MPADSTYYPYGGSPLGFEVGQRTDTFRADWPIRSTSTLYSRDARTFTRVRQRALIARKSLGFASLPSWMQGSTTSFTLDNSESIPFPDPTVFHVLRDILYGTPAALLVFAARYSRDAAFSLSTGLSLPHTAYRSTITAVSQLTLSDGRTIRAADSLWDFMTAFDPVSLPTDDETLVLRNLDPYVLEILQSTPGFSDQPHAVFPHVNYQKDGVAAAVWNNARSLSDDAYMPPVMSISPVASGFDLSCDSLWPQETGPWTNSAHACSYPIPLQPSLIYSNTPPAWTQLTSPGFIGPVSPSDGTHHFLLPGLPVSGGWELKNQSVSLGRAHLCQLSNGWDDAGELIRTPRRENETDFIYAGRQQRLWLAAVLNQTLGAATREGQERTLSAALCRSVIVPLWQGAGFTLPSNSTRVDALDYPEILANAVLTLERSELSLSGNTTIKSIQNLSSYKQVHVTLADVVLQKNVDYRLDTADGTTLYFAEPITVTTLAIIAKERIPFRLDSVENPTTLSPEPERFSSAWQGPLLISRGPVTHSCDAIKDTRLLQAGKRLPTLLGQGITQNVGTPNWNTLIERNPPMVAPPFDLDMGVFT